MNVNETEFAGFEFDRMREKLGFDETASAKEVFMKWRRAKVEVELWKKLNGKIIDTLTNPINPSELLFQVNIGEEYEDMSGNIIPPMVISTKRCFSDISFRRLRVTADNLVKDFYHYHRGAIPNRNINITGIRYRGEINCTHYFTVDWEFNDP